MRWMARLSNTTICLAAALGFSLMLAAASRAQLADGTRSPFAPITNEDDINAGHESYGIDRLFLNPVQLEIFTQYQPSTKNYGGPQYNPFGSDGGLTISGVRVGGVGRNTYTGFAEPTPVQPRAAGPGAAWDFVTPVVHSQEMYGGFGRHGASYAPSSMSDLLRRKPSMWAAYGGQTPIARATKRVSDTDGAAGRLGGGNAPMSEQLPDAVESDITLGDQWEERLRATGSRKILEAWGAFRMGDYRTAARGFETAQSLLPRHTTAGVGEVFCYVALGSRGTLEITLRQFAQRVENPFASTMKVTDFFSSPQEADRVRTIVQQIALDSASSNEARALQTLTLWYYGERDAAIAAAATLASGADAGSPYAKWPSLMQSTRRAIMATP
jgi:hypothetical protein